MCKFPSIFIKGRVQKSVYRLGSARTLRSHSNTVVVSDRKASPNYYQLELAFRTSTT